MIILVNKREPLRSIILQNEKKKKMRAIMETIPPLSVEKSENSIYPPTQ